MIPHSLRCKTACLAGVCLLAVLLLPATRSSVIEHARIVLGVMPAQAFLPPPSAYAPLPASLARGQRMDYARVASRRPDDVGVQMAAAVADSPFRLDGFEAQNVGRLRPLISRFPQSPALYANLVHFASWSLDTPQDGGYAKNAALPEAAGGPRPFALGDPLPRVSLAEYDRWAAAGERCDPDNAYFPMMRAVGYSAAGRRAGVATCLARAASKHRWEGYQSDLVFGLYSLPRDAYGRTDPLANTAAGYFEVRLDAPLRNLAAYVAQMATAEERSGRYEAAFRIRWDLIRAAAVWESHTRSFTSFMTARAVTGMAMEHFGDERTEPRGKLVPKEGRARRRAATLSRLVQIGHPEAAASLRRRLAESDTRFSRLSNGFHHTDIVRDLVRALAFWTAGLVLLDAGVWLLLLAGLGAWVGGQAGRGHPWRARLAAVAAVLALLAVQARTIQGAVWLTEAHNSAAAWAWPAVIAAIAGLGLPAAGVVLRGGIRRMAGRRRADRGRGLLAGWAMPAGCALVILYAVTTVASAGSQQRWRESTIRRAENECRYFASLADPVR